MVTSKSGQARTRRIWPATLVDPKLRDCASMKRIRPCQAPRLKAQLARSERERISEMLAECGGDRSLAAQRLGISRTTLWRKLRQA